MQTEQVTLVTHSYKAAKCGFKLAVFRDLSMSPWITQLSTKGASNLLAFIRPLILLNSIFRFL